MCSQFGSLFIFTFSGGFELQSQGCGTDMGRGYGTSGRSVVILGKELAWDIAVWLEKSNEKDFWLNLVSCGGTKTVSSCSF